VEVWVSDVKNGVMSVKIELPKKKKPYEKGVE